MVTRGRPRSFDRDAALAAAMKVFWQFGYEGASMAALTEAMRINSPSLYAAFGSKEALFKEAVELYRATEDRKTRCTLDEQSTARGAVESMLRRSVANLADPAGCRGCLLVLGDSNAAPEHGGIHDYLSQRRKEIQAALEERIKRGIADGDVPAHASAKAIAAWISLRRCARCRWMPPCSGAALLSPSTSRQPRQPAGSASLATLDRSMASIAPRAVRCSARLRRVFSSSVAM